MAATKQELRYDVDIAARIAAAFEEAYGDLTEVEAGKIIETNQTSVGRYRKGVTQIPFRVLLLVAERLRRGLDEIVQPWWVSVDPMVRIREQSIAIEGLRRQLADAERELATLRAGTLAPGAQSRKGRMPERVGANRLDQQRAPTKKRRPT